MNYLLDTHAFLWSLFSPEKLSKRSRHIIEDDIHNIYISTISFWEISLKYNLGKILLNNIKPEQLPKLAKESGFLILNLKEQEAATFYQLPRFKHLDPFDRLIAWQAIQNKFILITKDKEFQAYQGSQLQIVW